LSSKSVDSKMTTKAAPSSRTPKTSSFYAHPSVN
jgi:hypothetical protein